MPLPAWLHADLNQPLKAPLTSTVQNRSPERLAFIVAQFHLETAERFRKRDTDGRPGDETFCNFAAVAMTTAMGAPLPQMRANAIALWLEGQAIDEASQWEEINEHTAQAMADEGQVAVAVWVNEAGGPGHIAVLVPSLGEPGTWIAQAGTSNFTRGLLIKGFGDKTPRFYGHP
jgi:hypothetical protein